MDSCFTNEAHDGSLREKRGDLLITRDMRVFSAKLGCSGACDVVEFRRSESGIACTGRRDCISHSQWSISGVKNEATQPMHFSFVARLCVWKRCCAVTSHRGRFITAGPREEKW